MILGNFGRFPNRRKFRITPGVAPGTITIDPGAQKPEIQIIAFGPEGYEEGIFDDLKILNDYRAKWPTVWVHVQGFGDAAVLKSFQEEFVLHNLALEDVVNQNQRPKVESYDDHEYMVILAADLASTISLSQINLFMGNGFVITMVEKPATFFEPVRKRIREGRTRIRKLGAGYLTYALMDSVVDHYFPLLDKYADRLMNLEERALQQPDQEDIADIHKVNSELMTLRRALSPLKDVTRQLSQSTHDHIQEEIRFYFRDCHDHVVRLLDEVDADRELSRSLVDTCLSTMSNRMNEIMKVLTIIATIFIPLGFITGVYGMNFDPDKSPLNMPELAWYFGYPFALLLMVVVATGLLIYFRAKGWLVSRPRRSATKPPRSS